MGIPRRLSAFVMVAIVTASCSSTSTEACEPDTGGHSVARIWNEQILDAIRRDFPAPTVHSRNLYHLSAAMWDAWAAYDPDAPGLFVDVAARADDIDIARDVAISHAAYDVLRHRYLHAAGAETSVGSFDETMEKLCLDPADEGDAGDPVAIGNEIAAEILAETADDGSLEAELYVDTDYRPVNRPLDLTRSGTRLTDPNRWQPLAFEEAVAQNGLRLDSTIQTFVGPNWGWVTPFALDPAADGLPLDPGPPPYLGDPASDEEFKAAVVEVIEFSSRLDPADSEIIDIGPGAIGDNPLGTYDGTGHAVNPVTGEPYDPNLVPHADFGRVVAEFWADGPQSETPPGHWNTLANALSDDARLELRIGGDGPELDRLEWDVKLYLALNGAMHDAAVAAWGAKRHYDYVRPITMVRYMGGLGQSTDPDIEPYHPDGLPLEPGLIEIITPESAAPGERHDHLSEHVGEIAVRSWSAYPEDPELDVAGVDWIRAVDWVPYQRSTFVTPAFAGYVSGHSTFSRAGAEVLTAMTGSAFFPGGLGEWVIPANGLEFEAGPDEEIRLQWATYFDAADQAGISRLYGGIHVRADDLAGRVMGAMCGQLAWERAAELFGV